MNQRDSHPVFDRLGDFIDALDRAGELTRVTLPVSAKLELAAISDRVMKQPGGGRAVLFEHVLLDDGTRSRYPVAINLFGSMRRMAMALGAEDLDAIGGWPSSRSSLGCSRWPSFHRGCAGQVPRRRRS